MLKIDAARTNPSPVATQDTVSFLHSRFGGVVEAVGGRQMLAVILDKPIIFSMMSDPLVNGGRPTLIINGAAGASQPPVTISVVDQTSFTAFVSSNDLIGIASYEYDDDDGLLITFENRQGEAVIGKIPSPSNVNGNVAPGKISEVDPEA